MSGSQVLKLVPMATQIGLFPANCSLVFRQNNRFEIDSDPNSLGRKGKGRVGVVDWKEGRSQ
jgi:hypothetical protein